MRNPQFNQAMDDASEMFYGASGDAFAATGDSEFAFNANEGYDDNANRLYADGAQAPAVQAQTIPDFDRTYTVTISKSVAAPVPVILFGANQFLTASNFGNSPFLNPINVQESSYSEMLQESQLSPFIISGFRMTSPEVTNLDQVINILKRTGNGQRASYPLQVGNYFSAFQFQPNIREVYPYNITMEGTTQLSFTLYGAADVSTTITFFVGKRLGFGNHLHGAPIQEVSVQKLPFVAKQQLSLSPSTINALGGR